MLPDSNKERFDFLNQLGENLKQRSAEDLGKSMTAYAKTLSFITTETYGEIRITLKRVLSEASQILTANEKEDVQATINSLTATIHHWPVKPN